VLALGPEMNSASNEELSDADRTALANVQNRREPTSRWDNAPGDIVITRHGGKNVKIPT
jgi:hypothetical protein